MDRKFTCLVCYPTGKSPFFNLTDRQVEKGWNHCRTCDTDMTEMVPASSACNGRFRTGPYGDYIGNLPGLKSRKDTREYVPINISSTDNPSVQDD